MKNLGNYLKHPLTWLCAVLTLAVLSFEYYPIILRGMMEGVIKRSLLQETSMPKMPNASELLEDKLKPSPMPSFTEQATPKLD